RRAHPEGSGRKPPEQGMGASIATARPQPSAPEVEAQLMEEIVSRANMMAAYHRVMANKGAAGIDRMTVEQLQPHLKEHWPRIREELLEGRYRPQPVRGVEIPKPGGGMRQLGIPTVVDRLIQQAIHQVLMPRFDPGFSKASYGFRPGRSAHDAVLAARAHVAEGRRFVVDLDLEKFLDPASYCPLVHGFRSKSSDCRVISLMRKPFCLHFVT
ncbi:MAG TPA: reverse transcriptase domain-containing protein, partial [Pseudolabrys sp.]